MLINEDLKKRPSAIEVFDMYIYIVILFFSKRIQVDKFFLSRAHKVIPKCFYSRKIDSNTFYIEELLHKRFNKTK